MFVAHTSCRITHAEQVQTTYHCQEQVVHGCANQIHDIAQEPDVQEDKRQGLSRLSLVVGPQLTSRIAREYNVSQLQ
jgi:hypothetical protein